MFSQKEQTLLQDLRSGEELCIDKYAGHEAAAASPCLREIFHRIGQQEKSHRDTLDRILAGDPPPLPAAAGQSGQEAAPCVNYDTEEDHRRDRYLCADALATEKHVSSTYNVSIFEFKDKAVRDLLNHIQKEEQEHGKMIYDYMAQNGMYN
ncbi:MAG: spore coat protein [Firmicutes bacterium]|nr:spore coat protein [Bacillota bacterium]